MMRSYLKTFFILFLFVPLLGKTQSTVLPTRTQLAWHDMEFYLFVHFGPNTYTDKEWGLGDEPEDVFNPIDLDCRQWCRIAKTSGAKGIIITAKHHDGFCLWPSKYSTHTVRESKWKNGKGDVLKELSKACKEFGLKFGVYISPWDRNHPKYGTPEYNDVFVNMMKEIFQNYGPIWELWWDGANGEGPNGKKQIYDWRRFEKTVRSISPRTIIFSDIGPDARWCGNENGIAGKTNWNFLVTAGFTRGIGSPPNDTLNQGNVNGKNWIPAECDVSIRPGWFWHENENSKVKTPEQLFALYLKSVGRGANLLLNVPPNRNGLISTEDSASLLRFKKLRDGNLTDNLLREAKAYYQFSGNGLRTKDSKVGSFGSGAYGADIPNFIVKFFKPTTINCIILREAIRLGQTVKHFKIQLMNDNKPVGEIEGTTIGRKRILTFPSKQVTSFHVYLDDKKGNDNVSGVAAYLIDEKLVEK